jgi:Xaa-Pro aminopeptidase
MVVTLEPGIYIDGLGGGRIEHMIQVEENGARLLDRPGQYIEEDF